MHARRYPEAMRAALDAAHAEPLRERAHRLVVGIHLREGNVGSALRRYEEYRDLVRRELRVEPSALMTSLVADLR
jgi:DNA-binding SARP family transcriptional activator